MGNIMHNMEVKIRLNIINDMDSRLKLARKDTSFLFTIYSSQTLQAYIIFDEVNQVIKRKTGRNE